MTEGPTMTEPKVETDQARQGETGKGVRWVLIISVIAAVIGMGVIFALVL